MKKNIFITFILIVSMIAFMGMLNKVNAADVEITFKDKILYDKVIQFYNSSVTSKDADNLKIVMPDNVIAKITYLDLTGSAPTLTVSEDRRIKDLSGIEKFTALRTLRLDKNAITDLSPLANLVNLTVLDIRTNPDLTDVSVVENFPNLVQLILENCNISQDSIDAISKCTNLTKLSLGNNPNINDISKLKNLTKLQRIWVGRTSITSLDALKDLTTLKELTSNYNRNINSLESLKNLTNLEGLSLCGCSISDITQLSGLTKLTTLNLADNNITDISVISNLTNLKALNASNNHISDSTPVEGREWQGLDLSNQTISMKAKAGSTITLPEIFRATKDSSNVMYIPNEMEYSNCTKVDNNTIKLGNDGEISIIIVGLSQDKDNTFSWEEQYVSNNLNDKMIKSAQGSKLTITLEEEKKDSNEENKEDKNNTEKEEDKNTNTETDKDSNTDNKKNNTVKPKEDDTTSDGELPFTGKITVGVAIILAIITMTIFRLKYKKYIDIE